jgi:Spy/CpxP family protein refolding chaperone
MSGMTKRIVLGLSAAAITVALAGVGFATGQADGTQGPGFGRGSQGRSGGPGGPGGRFGRGGPGGPMGAIAPMMLNRLDLTNDQQDRVKQIMDSHRADQQAIGKRMMAAHDALESAITGSSFDEALIRTRAADVAAVEADQAVLGARIYAEVFQILTADQQTKLKTMQAEMQQRREARGGRGPR